jgi:hypothetical protein
MELVCDLYKKHHCSLTQREEFWGQSTSYITLCNKKITHYTSVRSFLKYEAVSITNVSFNTRAISLRICGLQVSIMTRLKTGWLEFESWQ